LFVVAADGSGSRRLTPRRITTFPPDERGGPGDINFSPDGKEICFTAVTDKMEAISTNGDLFIVAVAGGEAKRITTQSGFDGNPVYSPDGNISRTTRSLRRKYESDRWRVMLYDRQSGKSENLSEGFDRSANDLAWSRTARRFISPRRNETQQPVYCVAARRRARKPKKIIADRL